MKKRRKGTIGIFIVLLTASAGFLFYYMGNRTLKEEGLSGKGAAKEQEWSEEGEGYRLYYDESSGTYSYQIFSLENEIIEEGADIYRVAFIKEISDTIIHLAISVGSPARYECFFDRETGEKSEGYFNVSAVNNRTVVYMDWTQEGEICLVIKDMFDKNRLYKEIIRDFSPTAVPSNDLTKAVFLDDTTLEIEYYVGEDYDSVKEVITIF